jgi:hypothetical protein
MAGGMAQVVERLSSKPQYHKKKKEEEEEEDSGQCVKCQEAKELQSYLELYPS